MSVTRSFVAAAAFALIGCNQAPSGPGRSAGSLATSNDGRFLYVADTDNNTLSVLDSNSLEKVSVVSVGNSPFRVTVGKDDSVFVANRGSRSVSLIRKGEWNVAATIPTGVDPVGMQVSDDGKTLYVVSATARDTTDYGTLAAIDTDTLAQKWELPVGAEPRGLALVKGNKAVISQFKAGDLTTVDLTKIAVVQSSTTIYQQSNSSQLVNAGTATDPSSVPVTFQPRAMSDVVATPAGDRVFGLGVLSRAAPILISPSVTAPYYESQGPALAGSVVTPAVFTADIADNGVTPRVEDVTTASYTAGYYGYGYGSTGTAPTDQGYPQTSYAVSGYGTATVLQGPTVGITDSTGDWLFVVNRESSNVSVVSTHSRTARPDDSSNVGGTDIYYSAYSNELPSVYGTVSVGHGADGIAVMGDNLTTYVYSQFDHSLTKIVLNKSSGELEARGTTAVATDVLAPDVVAGRIAFHDANDRTMSALTASVACSSCHLEGRDDGHTWEFPDGPRQTPTLAGRGTLETAPYHWSGQFATITDFLNHTVTARMGGTGLDDTQIKNLNAYVAALPAPENPYQQASLTTQQAHGAALFESATCSSCHMGKWLNNEADKNVGTLVTNPLDPDDATEVPNGFNVPSLRGLARSAPYLHDGSSPSLLDRLNRNTGDLHGVTSSLSDQDKLDLVAYLQTL